MLKAWLCLRDDKDDPAGPHLQPISTQTSWLVCLLLLLFATVPNVSPRYQYQPRLRSWVHQFGQETAETEERKPSLSGQVTMVLRPTGASILSLMRSSKARLQCCIQVSSRCTKRPLPHSTTPEPSSRQNIKGGQAALRRKGCKTTAGNRWQRNSSSPHFQDIDVPLT
jgi:hypothetical protein